MKHSQSDNVLDMLLTAIKLVKTTNEQLISANINANYARNTSSIAAYNLKNAIETDDYGTIVTAATSIIDASNNLIAADTSVDRAIANTNSANDFVYYTTGAIGSSAVLAIGINVILTKGNAASLVALGLSVVALYLQKLNLDYGNYILNDIDSSSICETDMVTTAGDLTDPDMMA